MEMLAERRDALITYNSTSAVDFLLRGKPVFFVDPHSGDEFPSMAYGLRFTDLEDFVVSCDFGLSNHNKARLQFLKRTLNV
jgi:hypothetical protein